MEPNAVYFDALSEAQRRQLDVQYSADPLFGTDRRDYLYTLTTDGRVLSRRRMTRRELERAGARKA